MFVRIYKQTGALPVCLLKRGKNWGMQTSAVRPHSEILINIYILKHVNIS